MDVAGVQLCQVHARQCSYIGDGKVSITECSKAIGTCDVQIRNVGIAVYPLIREQEVVIRARHR